MSDSTAGERRVPPLVAGKYRLERELGRGGMGGVYRATHVALRSDVAIAIVLPELAANAVVNQRLLREARCAAQITGAHVVRVIDVGQLDSGEPFSEDGRELPARCSASRSR
jgi:serine/threonine protein kinase